MERITKKEEIDTLFQQDPLLALEVCKEWITKKFDLPENDVAMQKKDATTPKYMSVKQWASTFGYIPEGGIRHLIFKNPIFNKRVVKRIGKKVLLDVEALELWISEQNDHQPQ